MIVMMIDDVLDKRKQNTQRNSTKHLLTEDKLVKLLDEKISILPKRDTNLTGQNPGPSEPNDKAAAHLTVLLERENRSCQTSSHILKHKYMSCYLEFHGMLNSFAESGPNPVNMRSLYHHEPLKFCKIFLKNLTLSFSDYQTQSSVQNWVCYPAGGCTQMNWGIYFYAVLHCVLVECH